MKITATQYAKSLYEVTKDKSQKEIGGLISNFIDILVKNRQMKLAPKIIENFTKIWKKENGIVEAEVATVLELSSDQVYKVKSFIKDKYKAKEVLIKNTVNENIKGGMIIKVGDEVLDGSVNRQLKDLKNNLIS